MAVKLTEPEKIILEKIAEGASYEDCARETGYSHGTIRNLAHQLCEKLGADNIRHAVAIGFRRELLK